MGRSGYDRERSSRRSRSRSPSYKRRRSRSPDRNKRRDDDFYRGTDRERRDNRRDRDRERDRDRDRDRERSPKVEDIVGIDVNFQNFDMDAQQKQLEMLMQQRRERVEKWREQVRMKDPSASTSSQPEIVSPHQPTPPPLSTDKGKKKWTLDDEFDEDEEDDDDQTPQTTEIDDRELKMPKKKDDDEPSVGIKIAPVFEKITVKKPMIIGKPCLIKIEPLAPPTPSPQSVKPSKFLLTPPVIKHEPMDVTKSKETKDDDVDPLDAYMNSIHEQIKKERGTVKASKGDKKVAVIVGVARKSSTNIVKKGELVEQNQDALEYSSEDEATTTEDLSAMTNSLQNQSNKTKKLMTISKEDIIYIPFRKNFYIEVPELAKMTPEEVEAYRTELENIKVKGKGCPKPLKTWAQAGLSKRIMDVLKKKNYQKPTPIQCQAIPAIMSGRDIIGIAKTGSGKTLAFLLPMFRHILDQPPLEHGDGPIAVIMSPTRELATQIWSECKKLSKPLGLRAVCVYGGTPISEQIGELKPGAEIVVCTPGRMIDMLAANGGRVTNLRRCTYVVLDEADRMFDMGFEPQVMRIIDMLRPDRQTVMFSATFPRMMEALARRILTKPIEIQVGNRSVVCREVQQRVLVIEEEDKFLKLLELLGQYVNGEQSAIIFVDKQENADALLKELMHASYTCLSLHGGIDQQDRDSTIADFKSGKVKVLVATSVAARGLDVKNCILVVNYDCPNHYEDYVHRCGRTGRAGAKGYAWTFVTPDQARYVGELIKALELSGNTASDELKLMWINYKAKIELEGKKVKAISGFSGKGFKFDEAEAQLMNEKKKFQKAAFGIQDSDEEVDEGDIDADIENMLAPKKVVKTLQKAPAAPVINPIVLPTVNLAQPPIPLIPGSINDKLEAARRAASKISGNLVGKTASTTEAFLKGEPVMQPATISSAMSAKSKAEQIAERLHAKLNYVPSMEITDAGTGVVGGAGGEDGDRDGEANTAPVFQRFEEELIINDFPQQARWRVTSKEALAQISEYSEAGITVRGTYIPPGKSIDPATERKLYLAIEGTSEMSVNKAKQEIIRLIKEELLKLQNTYQPINKGRYKVV